MGGERSFTASPAKVGSAAGLTAACQLNSKPHFGWLQTRFLAGRWTNEITQASFDLHRWRCAQRMQNDAASFCRVDERVQMRLRETTLRLKIDLHVRGLKSDRHIFSYHERSTDICT